MQKLKIDVPTKVRTKPRTSAEALTFENPIYCKVNYDKKRPTGVILNAMPAICEEPENKTLGAVIGKLKARFSYRKNVVFNVPEALVAVFKEHFPEHLVMKRELAPDSM